MPDEKRPRKKEIVTPERVAKIAEWKRENCWRMELAINKELGLQERINAAIAAGHATSKQGFAIAAIEEKLEKLGF